MTHQPRVAVLVGNPRPGGRTWEAAHRIGEALGEVVYALDVVALGAELLTGGDELAAAVASVAAADVLVVASPTYKAAYSGVLKIFLDRIDGGTGLAGVVAVPLQLGGSPTHALAPELHLKPVLVELGATVPAPALYLLDRADRADPAEPAWLERWGPVVRGAVESMAADHLTSPHRSDGAAAPGQDHE